MSPEERLAQLGLVLPPVSAPAGNYASAVWSDTLLFVSGKAPASWQGSKPKGRIGEHYSADDGYALARIACLDLLATVRDTLGSLDQVVQFLDVHGALLTTPDFEDHARVLDGASDLLADIFGTAGLHARSVIGVASLRNGVPLTLKATLRCQPKITEGRHQS